MIELISKHSRSIPLSLSRSESSEEKSINIEKIDEEYIPSDFFDPPNSIKDDDIDDNKIYFIDPERNDKHKKKEKIFQIIKDRINPEKENLLGAKRRRRSKERKNKKEKEYNNRLKVARNFFNCFIITTINNSLIRNKQPSLYFEKFSQTFLKKIIEKKNKLYLKKNLKELLTSKELYEEKEKKGEEKKGEEKKEYEKFKHNLKALTILESNGEYENILKSSELNDILKKSYIVLYQDLYQKYLNSDEMKKMDESKAKELKKFNETFIQYFYR